MDCRSWEFGGNRAPHYTNMTVAGTIAFDVASRAFRNVRSLHVEWHDWGMTWSHRPVD
ncbi:MAG TPA: hypothetical protein VFF00_06535 [Candidatus Elarobacter sp.]|nr:hypothetical protein [Candidatus Elarobacter sp.]